MAPSDNGNAVENAINEQIAAADPAQSDTEAGANDTAEVEPETTAQPDAPEAAASEDSPEAFKAVLQQKYGIAVKESRGRWSYLTEGRQKPITGRKLGDAFEKAQSSEAYAAGLRFTTCRSRPRRSILCQSMGC